MPPTPAMGSEVVADAGAFVPTPRSASPDGAASGGRGRRVPYAASPFTGGGRRVGGGEVVNVACGRGSNHLSGGIVALAGDAELLVGHGRVGARTGEVA